MADLAREILWLEGLPGVRTAYRPGVWATYFHPRACRIQFGERCIRSRWLGEGSDRLHGDVPLRSVLGRASRPEERLAWLICHEVGHAVFASQRRSIYTDVEHSPAWQEIVADLMRRHGNYLARALEGFATGSVGKEESPPEPAKANTGVRGRKVDLRA